MDREEGGGEAATLLTDRHAKTIIHKILQLGGEARYSDLRALAVVEKKMPNATLHKRLKSLVKTGILETPQRARGKRKVARRTYRLKPGIIKRLEPAYRHFSECLKEAETSLNACDVEDFMDVFNKVWLNLNRELKDVTDSMLSWFIMAGLKNPETIKSEGVGVLLMLKLMVEDLLSFTYAALTEKGPLKGMEIRIAKEKWENMPAWEKQLVKNLVLAFTE
jgi:DNA-binding HxlR family transcriptional regulator